MSDDLLASGRAVVLDACALVPIRLTQTLLWLAEAGLFELLWSDQILDEVERNLPKVGLTKERAARRVAMMREAFGAAALVDDFDHLIADMTCHPKDAHVLAAAVRAEADLVVTFNLKNFPAASTNGLGVDVVHPDIFLVSLLADDPVGVLEALRRGCADLRNPPQTLTQFLGSLTPTVPIFANLTADQIRSPGENFSEGPHRSTPDASPHLRALSMGRLSLGRRHAREQVARVARSASSRRARPDRDHAFVPEVADTAQVFAAFVATVTFLTLVKVEDGTWRVWGLGPAVLAASEILQG